MAFLSFPYGWPWGISRDAPPPPPECVRTDGRTLVRWRHNQIFSAWWVTNFSYPWCFAGALRALKLRYKVTQTRFECILLFSWSYQHGLVFPPPLSLQILLLYQLLIFTNGKQDVLKQPRQARICYIFRVWVIIKALLKQIPYICYRFLGLGLSCWHVQRISTV